MNQKILMELVSDFKHNVPLKMLQGKYGLPIWMILGILERCKGLKDA